MAETRRGNETTTGLRVRGSAALGHHEQDHEGGRGEDRGREDVVPVVVVDLLLVEGNADRDRVLGPVVEHDERPQEVVPLSDEQEASGAVMLASLKMSSSRLP